MKMLRNWSNKRYGDIAKYRWDGSSEGDSKLSTQIAVAQAAEGHELVTLKRCVICEETMVVTDEEKNQRYFHIMEGPEETPIEIGQTCKVCYKCYDEELKPVRVLVCGGRDYQDRDFMWNKLEQVMAHVDSNNEFIYSLAHGAAKGADSLAGEWAKEKDIEVEEYPADWHIHGRSAGMYRNKVMLNTKPEYVIGFFGGVGTANMIRIAKEAGIKTHHFK
tara:strand:+ start:2446 stop:3102 length:657 start_codon:yes stop_codon:yes gene_type:complete